MNRLVFLVFCLFVLVSCKGQSNENKLEKLDQQSNEFRSFGRKIMPDGAKQVTVLVKNYQSMFNQDTLQCKVVAKVIDVCQAKGCWMTLDLGSGDNMMVKFKDYGFFVPKDISGKEVIINGKAFIKEVSVEEQKHYASDAGKSDKDISKITKPKRTYLFEADGVIIK